MSKQNTVPIKYALILFVSIVICMCIGFLTGAACTSAVDRASNKEIHVDSTKVKMDSVKVNIIAEIDNYMYCVAPGTEVCGATLFELCDNYNVDVRFAMAQAQVESHYATKGTAKKTKSVFNVGAYDGHSARRQIRNGFGYVDPNDSIEPYLILITTDYLVNGKTINDLMCNYVNKYNMRYATDRRYERMLRNVYNRINKNTDLDILIAEYNEYKAIIG